MDRTEIEKSDVYRAFVQHCETFQKSGTSADDVLLAGVGLLHAMIDADAMVPEILEKLVDVLSAVAPKTWWKCGCGAISPVTGEVDAYCEKCGSWRELPARLSYPVWTAWVQAACRRWPETWFSRLRQWADAHHLLAREAEEGSADVGRCGGGESASADGKHAGTAPAEGEAAYAGAAASGIDARGETSPIKSLHFIDGMIIFDDGKTCGTNWIALPLPDSAAMK